MFGIPRSALCLGCAGLLPFVWGAVTSFTPMFAAQMAGWIGPRFLGPYVQLGYGTVILSFMSGVLWGFATKATGRRAAMGYTLSVIPALWAFFMVGTTAEARALYLAMGFGGLIVLDWVFSEWGLTPIWWMPLRLMLTAGVVACLLIGVLA